MAAKPIESYAYGPGLSSKRNLVHFIFQLLFAATYVVSTYLWLYGGDNQEGWHWSVICELVMMLSAGALLAMAVSLLVACCRKPVAVYWEMAGVFAALSICVAVVLGRYAGPAVAFIAYVFAALCCQRQCKSSPFVGSSSKTGEAVSLLIASMATAVLAIASEVTLALFLRAAGLRVLPMVVSILVPVAAALICAWAYVRCTSDDSGDFFAAVRTVRPNSDEEQIVVELCNALESIDVRRAKELYQFLLVACPNVFISEIHEAAEPMVGACRVSSKLCYSIPRCLVRKALVLPTIVQKKTELTESLGLRIEDGKILRGVAGSEAIETMAAGIATAARLITNQMKLNCLDAARAAAQAVFDDRPDFYRLTWKEYTEKAREGFIAAGMSTAAFECLMKLLEIIWNSYREVKPIFAYVPSKGVGTVDASQRRVIVERRTPLVPLRIGHGTFLQRCVHGFSRLLSRRRTRYYYGIGNADRTANYHLKYIGPDGTHFIGLRLRICDVNMPYHHLTRLPNRPRLSTSTMAKARCQAKLKNEPQRN